MKNLKLLFSILVLGLMLASSGIANAASSSATQTLEATLGAYVDITPDSSAVTSTTIDPDTGNLAASLTSKFNIKLNSDQVLYLRANVQSDTTNETAFFKTGQDVNIVLGNVTNKPTVASINNAKAQNADPTQNPNVIAYKVSSVILGGASSAETPNYETNNSQYTINAKPGLTTATTTVSTMSVPNTYSFLDTAGTYSAVVTLTTSAT